MFELIIKLKNKNDDLVVKTLVSTDQAIIYNTIMEDLYDNYSSFSCSNINISDNIFKYKEFTNIVSEYASIDYDSARDCSYTSSEITINIGINVNQLPDDNFNVSINYKIPS